MRAGGTAVVPSDEPLLEPWLRDDLEVVTLRPGRRRLLRGLVAEVAASMPDAPPTRHVVIARRRAGRARAAVRLRAQPAQRARRRGRRAGDRGATRAGASTCASPRCGASAWRSRSGAVVDQRLLQRQPAVHARRPRRSRLAARRRAAASRCSATCSSSAPPSASTTARSAPTRPSAGVDAAGDRRAARRGDARRVRRRVARGADAAEAAALLPRARAPGRRRAGQGLARRRARGRRRGARRPPADGRGPDRGDGVAAHLHLPVARSSSRSCASASSASSIREEGPQEHHAKAGTPTMGGIIIFTAIAVPFLLLTDVRRRARSACSASRSRARCWASPTTTRSSSRRRSLGLRGADEADRHDGDLDRAVARGHALGGPAGHASTCGSSTPDRPRLLLSGLHLPRGGGDDLGGQPDRRPRRAGGRLRGDRAARLHRDHVHDAPVRPRAGGGVPGRRAASASCGSTRSRPRSSWATPGHSGWAARSPGSR